ncbi:MAG: hypothetical protein ACC667_10330 [Longimicrobiales bacterium]
MPKPRHILWEGLVTGLIGAGGVAFWFLLVDMVAGRPLYTPAVLGSAATLGLRDPALVVINLQSVGAYTAFHVLAFFAVGVVASALAHEAEKSLHVLWLVVEFFLIFEFAFYAAVGLVFAPLLAELAWINVAAGNLIAAAGMGYYLLYAHPEIASQLKSLDTEDASEAE